MEKIKISKIATQIIKKDLDKRIGKPFKSYKPEYGEFIKIPINDANGHTNNIVAFLALTSNPLPGNPIVLFAPGDNETILNYEKYHKAFCPYGCNFCVMDYRGRGFSEGSYITYHENEVDDVLTVIRYLKANGYDKISYFGRSRGAICGFYAITEFPDICSIALDSPALYSDDEEEEEEENKSDTDSSDDEDDVYISKKFGISIEEAKELLPDVYKEVAKKTGVDFSKVYIKTKKLAENITQPIYVIHGRYDRNIPIKDSIKLMEIVKSQDKQFEPFNGNHNDGTRIFYWFEQFYFILEHFGFEMQKEEYMSKIAEDCLY